MDPSIEVRKAPTMRRYDVYVNNIFIQRHSQKAHAENQANLFNTLLNS